MAFPTIVSSTLSAQAANTTSHPIALPATINSGDLLVALFTSDGNPTITWDNSTAGTWTSLFNVAAPSNVHRLACWYKVAAGTEDGLSLAVTTSASEQTNAYVLRITGASGNVEAATATATSTSADPPSLTPTWGAKDILWLIAAGVDGSATITGSDGNYSAVTQNLSSAGQGGSLGYASRNLNASNTDPSAFTASASVGNVAATIAIEPAAGGTAYTLTAAAGSFTLTGQSAGLRVDRRLTAAAGSFALAGQNATLRVARRLVAAAGSFALTGQAATLRRGYSLAAGAGSFALTGMAAGLSVARRLVAGAGAFVLTGYDATLIYTPATTGTTTVTPVTLTFAPQFFETDPGITFVGPTMFRFAPQAFTASSELELDNGLGDLANIRLERLERSYQIVDQQGRPDFAFQRWWERTVGALEDAIQSLAQSGINTNEVLARLLAAEQSARDANIAAEQAQAQAAVQADLQRVRDSGVDANPLSATTTGSSSTITIAAHSRVYLDPPETLPVVGGSISGLTPGTTYYVSYLDPALSGGSVTYEVATDEAMATASASDPYRHKVGGITTPATSGGSSTGAGSAPPWKFSEGDIPII